MAYQKYEVKPVNTIEDKNAGIVWQSFDGVDAIAKTSVQYGRWNRISVFYLKDRRIACRAWGHEGGAYAIEMIGKDINEMESIMIDAWGERRGRGLAARLEKAMFELDLVVNYDPLFYKQLNEPVVVNELRLNSDGLFEGSVIVHGSVGIAVNGMTAEHIINTLETELIKPQMCMPSDTDFWMRNIHDTMTQLQDEHVTASLATLVRVDDHQPDEEPIVTNLAEAKSDLRDLWCDDEGVDREWFESIDSMTFEELNDAWGGVGYSLEPLEEWLSRQPREKQWETLRING
jgi:hypothetical protein